ncbi:hypothetical protein HDU96_011099 [Phlyctochytrium bullatum]|nr:hypothetical protein HDU96_011099 [Phlyctochytrium bullatum]
METIGKDRDANELRHFALGGTLIKTPSPSDEKWNRVQSKKRTRQSAELPEFFKEVNAMKVELQHRRDCLSILLPDYGARTVFNRIGSKSPLPSLKVAEMHQTGLTALLLGRARGVAKRIPVMVYGRHRPLVLVGGRIPRGWMRALMSWVLGNVARHQPCEACGDELSRQHALECSGVGASLAERFPGSDPARHPHLLPSSILDVLIHSLTFRDNVAEQARVQACVEAVDEIRRICLGFQPFKDLDYSTAQEEFLSISHSICPGAPLLDETERELRAAIALDYEPRALWILPPPGSVEL